MKTPVNGLCVLLYFRSDFTTNFFGLELVFFTVFSQSFSKKYQLFYCHIGNNLNVVSLTFKLFIWICWHPASSFHKIVIRSAEIYSYFTLIGDGTDMVFATSIKPCEPMIQKLNKCKPKLFPQINVSERYHLAGKTHKFKKLNSPTKLPSTQLAPCII